MPPYVQSKAFIGSGAVIAIGPAAGAVIPTGLTGTTTSASPNLTLSAAPAASIIGLTVAATGIPTGATIISGSGTAYIMSANATASGSAVALTFTITYTNIMELTNNPLKPREYDKIETTNFNSTGKEYLQGMADLGTMPIEGNSRFGDPGQTAVSAAWTAKGAYMFKVTLPLQPGQATTGDVATFNALVMSYTELGDLDPKKVVQIKGELQITNTYAYTPGS